VRGMTWVKQKVLNVKPLYVYKGLKQYWFICELQLRSNRNKEYAITMAIPITWQGEYLQKFINAIEGKIEVKEERPKRVFECVDSVSDTNANNETVIANIPIIAEAEAKICKELGDKVIIVPFEYVWVNFNAKLVKLFEG